MRAETFSGAGQEVLNYPLRKENDRFLERNVRAFSTGCAAIICDVIKKYKIQVYYMNVTNLTVQNGCVMIAVNGGSTYAKEPEKP